jgi:GGDEF domain-containing protein
MSVIEICELQSNWGKVLEQVRPEDGTTAEALIRSADKAMYQVKHQGKNNFGFISVQNST